TAAAELAVADGAALAVELRKERRRLDREIRHRMDRARQDLDHQAMALHARRRIFARGAQLAELTRRLTAMHPAQRLARAGHELAQLVARRDAAMRRGLAARRAQLGQLGAGMAALSP